MTLRGRHEDCGGTVIFRPVTYRRELLAGESVELRSICRQCGASITIDYALPTDAAASGGSVVQGAFARAVEQERPQELPMVAGDETRSHWPRASAGRGDGAATVDWGSAEAGDKSGGSVTELSEWRARASGSGADEQEAPAGSAKVQVAPTAPDQDEPSQPEAAHVAPQPPTEPGAGEAAYIEHFLQRFEAAREAVRRVREELPEVLTDREWSSPQLASAQPEEGPAPMAAFAAAPPLQSVSPPAPELYEPPQGQPEYPEELQPQPEYPEQPQQEQQLQPSEPVAETQPHALPPEPAPPAPPAAELAPVAQPAPAAVPPPPLELVSPPPQADLAAPAPPEAQVMPDQVPTYPQAPPPLTLSEPPSVGDPPAGDAPAGAPAGDGIFAAGQPRGFDWEGEPDADAFSGSSFAQEDTAQASGSGRTRLLALAGLLLVVAALAAGWFVFGNKAPADVTIAPPAPVSPVPAGDDPSGAAGPEAEAPVDAPANGSVKGDAPADEGAAGPPTETPTGDAPTPSAGGEANGLASAADTAESAADVSDPFQP